jgi:hypothetical protein
MVAFSSIESGVEWKNNFSFKLDIQNVINSQFTLQLSCLTAETVIKKSIINWIDILSEQSKIMCCSCSKDICSKILTNTTFDLSCNYFPLILCLSTKLCLLYNWNNFNISRNKYIKMWVKIIRSGFINRI